MANNTIIAPNQLSVQSVAAISGGGQITNAPAFTLADLSQPGPPPQTIDQTQESVNPLVLTYPADSPPYFFKLAIYKFQRKDWLSVGQADPISWIVLPLPIEMMDEGGVSYNTQSLGALQGNLIGAANALVQQGLPGVQDVVKQIGSSINQNIVGGAANELAVKANAANLLAAAGSAVNQFQSVCLQGPQYKRRQFAWKLSPETAAESETVRQIIQRLNNCSAPSLKGGLVGSAFFGWPCLFRPSFQFMGPFGDGSLGNVLGAQTFYMKYCVLDGWSYNYSPAGQASFYAGTHAPTIVTITLSFQEIEFWLRDDYMMSGPGDGNNPANFQNPAISVGQAINNLTSPSPGPTVGPSVPQALILGGS